MRRFLGKVTDLPYAVLASATVAVIAAPGEASAQETISNLSTEWRSHIGELGNLVVAGGFLAGIALIAAGLMKLKQAADTQGQQVKYSEGMWRSEEHQSELQSLMRISYAVFCL